MHALRMPLYAKEILEVQAGHPPSRRTGRSDGRARRVLVFARALWRYGDARLTVIRCALS